MVKGARVFLDALKKNGVKHLFGIPGGVIIPFYDELYDDPDVKHILVRHEQGAAHMAEGYARASGKVGTCIGTSGPGATNLVTGIADAFMDSVPIVAIGGQVATNLIGKDAFQEADLMGITRPITKHGFQITDANEIESIVDNAYKIASTNRPGPVFIELPKDVQLKEVDQKKEVFLKGYEIVKGFKSKEVNEAAKLILEAQRPVVLVGGGAVHANCVNEVRELAETCFLPVASTLQGKGVFDETHPLSLGMTGMHGQPPAVYAIQKSDLLIAIGCRLDDRVTGRLSDFAPEARVIHVDIDPSEIHKNRKADVALHGNAREVLGELVRVVKKLKHKSKPWLDKLKVLQKEYEESIDINAHPIDPRKLMHELQRVLNIKKNNFVLTTGVGEHQMYAAHYLKFFNPRSFISSGGLGTMGFGLPAAIGAKVAVPSKEVFNLDGDGSFAMTLQELATAKVNRIKVINVIMNNGYLGMVRSWNDLFYGGRRSQVELGKVPNFCKLAEAYGLEGVFVERASEIREALERALNNPEASVIDVQVDPNLIVLPIVPAGASNSEMIGKKIPKGYFEK